MSNNEKIQIQIVTWDSEKEIERCLQSIFRQSLPIHRILVIDNNSKDQTREICRRHKEVEIVLLNSNTGYAHAHNVGIRHGKDCKYILILNPDIELSDTSVASCLKTMQTYQKVATVSPVCIRDELTNDSKIITIDAAGIAHSQVFHFKNLFEGKHVQRETLHDQKVFANTGACIFVSTDALKDIKQISRENQPEYFDEFFFAYKEDIDLCWRLSRHGYTHYINTNIVRHKRSLKSATPLKNRNTQLKLYSYRNHILCLWKNLTIRQIILFGFFIALYELAKCVYYFLTSPRILILSWKDIFLYITSHNRLA